ncbi:MAG: hypothetical protein JJ835_001865 [Prochlorococcus marinus XMU1426]|nr:hypothetical protein [Prochlorococcus marinus XMU1426]
MGRKKKKKNRKNNKMEIESNSKIGKINNQSFEDLNSIPSKISISDLQNIIKNKNLKELKELKEFKDEDPLVQIKKYSEHINIFIENILDKDEYPLLKIKTGALIFINKIIEYHELMINNICQDLEASEIETYELFLKDKEKLLIVYEILKNVNLGKNDFHNFI